MQIHQLMYDESSNQLHAVDRQLERVFYKYRRELGASSKNIENDVFIIQDYDNRECNCGLKEQALVFQNSQAHEKDCDFRSDSLDSCTCGAREAFAEWIKDKAHEPTCEVEIPNFHFKPTGFKIWWYKYAFRSACSNMPLDETLLAEMLEQCLVSFPDRVPDVVRTSMTQEEFARSRDKFFGNAVVGNFFSSRGSVEVNGYPGAKTVDINKS